LIGKGVRLDARGKEKIDATILTGHIIEPKDIVIKVTGWSAKYNQPEYYEKYPEVTSDLGQKLIDNQISIIGMDTPSPDHPPFLVHKMFLEKNILIIENLTNLEKLLNHQNFEIIALPAKFATEAAPCRVVARII
jgi:kynurenine formamidase